MSKKQFKTESKRILDLMVNSIYTNKEIFLRELISNASDAIDKLYFRSLTDQSVGKSRSDFVITLKLDQDARQITICDNGIGMTQEELEQNLGTIAHSGSGEFVKQNELNEEIDIIGQFGVGFYSAFMVADKVTVVSRALARIRPAAGSLRAGMATPLPRLKKRMPEPKLRCISNRILRMSIIPNF